MSQILYGLTLINPWPYCITDLDKRVENRSWAPPLALLGQRVAIHAAKGINTDEWAAAGAVVPAIRKLPLSATPYGAVVALVTLAGVVRVNREGEVTERGGKAAKTYNPRVDCWFAGPYGWLLTDVVKLPEPVACRGNQKLWSLPPAIYTQVMAQV